MSKANALVSKPETQAGWYGPPLGEYFIQTQTDVAAHIDQIDELYSLNDAQQQKRLLGEFLKINTNNDAFAWIKTNGFPAQFMDDVSLKRSINKHSLKPYGYEILPTMVAAADHIRWIIRLTDAMRTAATDWKFDKLEKEIALFVNEISNDSQQIEKTKKGFKGYFTAGCGLVDMKLEGFQLPPQSSKNMRKQFMMSSAQHLTAFAVNTMLSGVTPTSEWDSEGKFLIHSFNSRCPWHSIALELTRKINRRPTVPNSCPHPRCGKSMEGKRSQSKSCGDEACRKWVQRHPDGY